MTESEKKMASAMLNWIYDVQSKAKSDHSPGAGMVRGAFGEYLLLSAFQDLLRTLLFNADKQCENCGGVLDDLMAYQKQLNKSLSAISELDSQALSLLVEIRNVRKAMEDFNDKQNV